MPPTDPASAGLPPLTAQDIAGIRSWCENHPGSREGLLLAEIDRLVALLERTQPLLRGADDYDMGLETQVREAVERLQGPA